MAGLLCPGNAAAWSAEDHITVLDAALALNYNLTARRPPHAAQAPYRGKCFAILPFGESLSNSGRCSIAFQRIRQEVEHVDLSLRKLGR